MITPKPLVGAMLVLAAAGCAETNDVKETGADSYFLAENYSRGLFEAARAKGMSRAGEYCVKTNRKVLVEYVLRGNTNEHGGGSALVTFRCLYRADPELQRAK